jgi:hypothetical protein
MRLRESGEQPGKLADEWGPGAVPTGLAASKLPAIDAHPAVPKVVSMLPGAPAAAAPEAVATAIAPPATRAASRMPGTRYRARRRRPAGMVTDLGMEGRLPSSAKQATERVRTRALLVAR